MEAELTDAKDCTKCFWYWQNNDTENECEGLEKPCHEFILAGQEGKV